ncbi:hypothetical protein HYDPIDRAFT_112711 [Hydnomerulius pinastri MD-312]|uniref:Uncharacterized protein n=1 Tax=Hydnomerulius pinastri MD-312 TaxID=994086 RepID=A0A0C9VE19_9AGAM|nr:hypothetical protein HYDPIDRAFT_112711 [Hydnomerulius pinastri MD-312]
MQAQTGDSSITNDPNFKLGLKNGKITIKVFVPPPTTSGSLTSSTPLPYLASPPRSSRSSGFVSCLVGAAGTHPIVAHR